MIVGQRSPPSGSVVRMMTSPLRAMTSVVPANSVSDLRDDFRTQRPDQGEQCGSRVIAHAGTRRVVLKIVQHLRIRGARHRPGYGFGRDCAYWLAVFGDGD